MTISLGIGAVTLVGIVVYVSAISLLRQFTRRIGTHTSVAGASFAEVSTSEGNTHFAPQILGRITIQKGSHTAELDVAGAVFTLVKMGDERVMVYYVLANGDRDRQPLADVDGNPHPGARMMIYHWFDPHFVDEPPMRILVRDLEDPIHDVTPRVGIPASMLFDDEISAIVRFKMRFNHEKSSSDEPWLDCEARTAGGLHGGPAPFRISIQSKFRWIPPMNLDEGGWPAVGLELARAATAHKARISPANY